MILEILEQTARDYPRAWSKAHKKDDPERWDFIKLAVQRLYSAEDQIERNVRGNWRRGTRGDLSMDGISVFVDGQWRFADVITGAGGPDPRIGYRTPGPEASLKNSAGQYIGEAGAPTPAEILQYHGPTHYDYSGTQEHEPPPPPPPPTVTCNFQPAPAVDFGPLRQEQQATYAVVAAIQDELSFVREQNQQLLNLLRNIDARLQQGLVLNASARVIGGINGTVKG